MTKLPKYQEIARDFDGQVGYLLIRCLAAEGKDPDDHDAMVALITDAENASREYGRPQQRHQV